MATGPWMFANYPSVDEPDHQLPCSVAELDHQNACTAEELSAADINSLRGLAHAPMDVASEMVSEIESEMGLDSLSIYWRKHGSNQV